jgi:hypothetical protein
MSSEGRAVKPTLFCTRRNTGTSGKCALGTLASTFGAGIKLRRIEAQNIGLERPILLITSGMAPWYASLFRPFLCVNPGQGQCVLVSSDADGLGSNCKAAWNCVAVKRPAHERENLKVGMNARERDSSIDAYGCRNIDDPKTPHYWHSSPWQDPGASWISTLA